MESEIIKHDRNMHTLRVSGYSLGFFLCSDIHFDSKNCDRELLKKHFDIAKEENRKILIVGDWFDLMQGRYDPRRSNQGKNMRQEYLESDKEYLDAVMEDSVKFLTPYADHIVFIGLGNHEMSFTKNSGSNPTENLVTLLNHVSKSKIEYTGYSGWLRIQFHKDNSHVRKYMIKYRHGDRGNAQRSKGILQVDIDSMKWPDADLIIKGDDHQKWLYPSVVRKVPNIKMKIVNKVQRHIRLGSYVDDVKYEFDGFVTERGFSPTKLGGWFVDVNFFGQKKRNLSVKINEAE